jgi:hypothetical protein
MTAESGRKYKHDTLIHESDYWVDVSIKCATLSGFGNRKMSGIDPIMNNFVRNM